MNTSDNSRTFNLTKLKKKQPEHILSKQQYESCTWAEDWLFGGHVEIGQS